MRKKFAIILALAMGITSLAGCAGGVIPEPREAVLHKAMERAVRKRFRKAEQKVMRGAALRAAILRSQW